MLDSLSNVKSRLGITVSTYDTFLTQQITLISDVIEAYCRRKFISANYEQTYYKDENNPSKAMELYHFPVTAVASIVIDTETLDSSKYRLHGPSGRLISKEGCFFLGDETVVTYTAGYATCPTPVLSVLDAVVGERYNKKAAGVDLNFGSDVQRVSIPGAISIDFDYSLSNNERTSAYGSILGSNVNILDDWRSERAVFGSDKLKYVEVV
jgi:hypothetical protein